MIVSNVSIAGSLTTNAPVMRELLVLVVLLPVALVVVLNQELATLQSSTLVPTPVTIRVAVPTPTAAPAIQTSSVAALIANALTWLGVPYHWGGCSHAGVDCSCYMQAIFRAVGIELPRTSSQQWAATPRVAQSDLRPFDLVFFRDTCTDCGPNPTHVGAYLGNGQMIQAGGAAVSIQPAFSGFYGQHYMGAGRILN